MIECLFLVLFGTLQSTEAASLVGSSGGAVVKGEPKLELIEDAGVLWRIPSGVTRLSVLAVGGGGGGAPGLGNAAGGGGAGGLVFVDDYLRQYGAKPGDAVEIRVGMPGAVVSMTQGRRGNPGTNTVFGKIVALGGGGGGRGSGGLATSGGSAGGGLLDATKALPAALQPAESGFGIGFGHAGGGEGGVGGGGAGGPGTPMGKGGGGIGLQGVPKAVYVDKTTGFVTEEFDAKQADHHRLLFRDLFGEGFGEDGWFAGGGAVTTPYHDDPGGKGGGSRQDALPHTGGGGGGSTHGYQGSDPGIGGSGVVIVRCQYADGSCRVQGWGCAQPDEFRVRHVMREPNYLLREGKYEEALAALDKHRDLDRQPLAVQVEAARAYGLIYAAMGREEEALAKFKQANAMESGNNGSGAASAVTPTPSAGKPPASATATSAWKGGPLLAGTAKVDITPHEAFISAKGESWRLPDPAAAADGKKTPPANIHDRIFARVLVLKNDETSLAIVSLDLILFSSKKVVTEAKAKWKVDHVILSCSHTHSSMLPRGLCPTDSERKPPLTAASWGWDYVHDDPGVTVDWPGLSEDPWYAATEARIVAAIGEASTNLFPAQIAAGRGPFESAYMAHNRRLVNANGTVTDMWDNPKRLPTQPIDPTVGIVQVDDASGKPRAFLVHYACHPVGLMNSKVLSRDFPGAMVDYVEQELGGDCMAMFLQGAQGDQDPYDTGLHGEHGFNLMRQAGISLGKGALRVARTLKPRQNTRRSSIKVKESLVKLPHRNGDKVTEACVLTAVINDELALATVPGEIFIQHQLDLAQQSPIASTLLLGVAYCGAGSPFLIYVPTAQAAKEGGYGAHVNRCSFVSGDAGERMVNAAVAAIEELRAGCGSTAGTKKP